MAVTPVGNPYVESSDLVANYPGASEALAERIDIVGVNPFANAAARDAAIPSPVQGQMCSLNDDNKGYRYDGSAWILFSGAGDANFTNVATGTYTDAGISYKYKTYTGSGSVTFDKSGYADFLIISGGGGGSGGGGANGGYIERSIFVPAGTYTVTIGAGGASNVGGGQASSGTKTAINPFTTEGGVGANGSTGGSTLFGQGNAGTVGATGSSGGGGGSGGAAGAAASNVGGAGGAGTSSSLTGSAVIRSGGGGGGAATTGGAGGSGGGGVGSSGTSAPGAGSANTGGGGGGQYAAANAAPGGSGALIIRVVV
jgi:hypothetical protein